MSEGATGMRICNVLPCFFRPERQASYDIIGINCMCLKTKGHGGLICQDVTNEIDGKIC